MGEEDRKELSNIEYNLAMLQERLTQLANRNESKATTFSAALLGLRECQVKLETVSDV
ncbi:hypothetical protein [Zhongshania sp.]|uniref:hypothetical protein n=1 Tax=Zhongshania sp. TaxID=1971902 RepID=UPI0035674183